MFEQTLNRYSGSGEDWLASENFRVSRHDVSHKAIITPARRKRKPTQCVPALGSVTVPISKIHKRLPLSLL
jgi:hypothetical protein